MCQLLKYYASYCLKNPMLYTDPKNMYKEKSEDKEEQIIQ